MTLQEVARRAKVSHGDRLPGAQRHRPREGSRARPRPQGGRRAQLPPEHPREDARPRSQPHPGPHRLQPEEPLLPRHLPGPGERRPREGVRGRGRQHRLSTGAARDPREADAGTTGGGARGHRLGDGAHAGRGAPGEPDPHRLLRRGGGGPPLREDQDGLRPGHAPGRRVPARRWATGAWPSSVTTPRSLPCTFGSAPSPRRCGTAAGTRPARRWWPRKTAPRGASTPPGSCSRPASTRPPSSASTTSWPSA